MLVLNRFGDIVDDVPRDDRRTGRCDQVRRGKRKIHRRSGSFPGLFKRRAVYDRIFEDLDLDVGLPGEFVPAVVSLAGDRRHGDYAGQALLGQRALYLVYDVQRIFLDRRNSAVVKDAFYLVLYIIDNIRHIYIY